MMRRTIGWLTVAALVVFGGVVRAEDHDERDPWQGYNRAIFSFNDAVDHWVLEPVAKGYDVVVPDPLERCFSNFFQNLRVPINSVNGFLQGKPVNGASDVGRFAVNTTIGLAGFLDPATYIGLERHDEDFGQTLAVWGVPAGPYVVWPLYGASTVRDSGGAVADTAMSVMPFFLESYVTIGARIFETVNARALVLEDVERARSAALDWYTSVRNAYLQRRETLIHDEKDTTRATDDTLYFPDDEKK
jgi:phospholipid-binding lipoprotein MlaA